MKGFPGNSELIERLKNLTLSEMVCRLKEQIAFLRDKINIIVLGKPKVKFLRRGKSTLPEVLITSFKYRNSTCRLWKELFPESVKHVISIADEIVENRILVFSDTASYDDTIEWHRDYLSGEKVPLKFYRDLHNIAPSEEVDPKNIWELNRHNFLLTLGMAYWGTNNHAYYEKWKKTIISWIDNNPYNRGINWESSIELAIRAINWIWSSYFFQNELEKDIQLQNRIIKSLYLHAEHIYHHLSHYFSPNTHLTIEALGLIYVGLAYPSLKRSAAWVSTGKKILEEELNKQILGDGGYFERATYYHKYTVDLYLHYLALFGNKDASEKIDLRKIKEMVKHLVLLSEPDGTIPLLGDSDGGGLLFTSSAKRDIRGACCTAAVLLNDGELKNLCGNQFREDALWFLGNEGYACFQALETIPLENYHSINNDTGFYCFKSGLSKTDSFVTIDCGPHGWGSFGHAHSDLLSFEWYCEGMKIIVDRGTNTYFASKRSRDRVRSSQFHNTITMNGISQSIPGGTFKWEKVAHPESVFAKAIGNSGYFEGEHDAYNAIGCNHKRALIFINRELTVIIDFIGITQPQSSLIYHLQFNQGNIKDLGNEMYRFKNEDFSNDVYIKFLSAATFSARVEKGEIYPDYNKIVPAPVVELRESTLTESHKIITLLSNNKVLMDNIESDGDSFITGKSNSAGYSIFFNKPDSISKKEGKGVIEISAYISYEKKKLAILRNSNGSINSKGDCWFKSCIIHDFLSASIEKNVLLLSCTEVPPSIFLSLEIKEIFVNGNKTLFKKEGDEIKIGTS